MRKGITTKPRWGGEILENKIVEKPKSDEEGNEWNPDPFFLEMLPMEDFFHCLLHLRMIAVWVITGQIMRCVVWGKYV